MTDMGMGRFMLDRRFARFTRIAAGIALVAAGCSNPSPRSTGLTLPTGVGGGPGTLSGSLTSYTSGAPVPGTTVRLGPIIATSDASGKFTLPGTPVNGTAVVTASAPGYVYRGVSFTLAPTRGDLALDLIPDSAPFSLFFYRMFVRNALNTATLEPLRRWTVNPNFYFRTVTLDTNSVPVPANVIQSIQDNFVRSVPELSGGRFQAGTFESGTTERAPADGWVNVVFWTTIPGGGGVLGFSTVGGNSGTITIAYNPSGPNTPTINPGDCSTVALAVADHEITHTMGFWHTDNVLEDTLSGPGCTGTGRPEHTRFHANVAYSRPVGNMDPDVDTTSSAHLTASGPGARPTVVCDLNTFRRR